MEMKMLMDSTQGLMQASERHGFEGEGFSYVKSPVWWAGAVMRRQSAPFCTHNDKLTNVLG